MKFKNVLILLLLISISTFANAQMKIGYVNIELVLAYLPETKTMNQELQTYQQKLGEKLSVKQQYAQTKVEEYQTIAQTDSPDAQAELKTLEQELIKLEEEIKKAASEADQNLMKKRQELLEPILKKMESNLKSLADEQSYDYILNTVDGNGVSIVLHGPEEHDLTQVLMKKLGIEIPTNN